MKKLLISVALITAGILSAHAEWALKLTLNDGTQPCYVLAERPVIKMDGGEMIISCNGATASYARTSVQNMTFIDRTSSVTDIEGATSVLVYTDDNIKAPGAIINVYDIAGRKCISGFEELSLKDLPAGIYVVSTPYQSLKIVK